MPKTYDFVRFYKNGQQKLCRIDKREEKKNSVAFWAQEVYNR